MRLTMFDINVTAHMTICSVLADTFQEHFPQQDAIARPMIKIGSLAGAIVMVRCLEAVFVFLKRAHQS